MTDKEIMIESKQQYGKEVFYPLGDDAVFFADIARAKTLTQDVLKNILRLGYDIKVYTRISGKLVYVYEYGVD